MPGLLFVRADSGCTATSELAKCACMCVCVSVCVRVCMCVGVCLCVEVMESETQE